MIRIERLARLILVTVALAVGSFPFPARAGQMFTSEVRFYSFPGKGSPEHFFFTGALADARHSSDSTQYIGCTDRGDYAVCSARDVAGNTASCVLGANDKDLLAVLRGITDGSYLSVEYDPDTGDCKEIFVTNSSFYGTK